MSQELSDARDFIAWMNQKSKLNAIASNAAKRAVRRGEVYYCHFGLNVGSEMSKPTPRPGVIVQNWKGNLNAPNTIVVPVTHNASTLPFIVPIDPPIRNAAGNIVLDGEINPSNIVCVSKARLGDYIATLPAAYMKKVDESIAHILELTHYYAELNKKLASLNRYTQRVKEQRNAAQDKLAELSSLLESVALEENVRAQIKKILDN